MGAMRRAVLAILLCAAPLMAAPAHASDDLGQLQALRAVGVKSLPLAGRHEASVGGFASIAAATRPVRVLVGVRTHEDLPGVAQTLAGLGGTPEAFDSIGVLAATVPDGEALARALGGDPRVAYV